MQITTKFEQTYNLTAFFNSVLQICILIYWPVGLDNMIHTGQTNKYLYKGIYCFNISDCTVCVANQLHCCFPTILDSENFCINVTKNVALSNFVFLNWRMYYNKGQL